MSIRKRDWSKRTALQDELILSNIKLARFCARKVARHIGNEIELEELESEAFLWLVVAAGGFKPEMGFKFSTYATRSIISRVWRFMHEWRELTLTHREAIEEGITEQIRKLSLDMPLAGTDNVKLGDSLPDTRDEILVWMERVSQRAQISDLMNRARLTHTEKLCMTRVYLDGTEPITLAKERGTTRKAVYQALKLGFKKLLVVAGQSKSHRTPLDNRKML